MSAMSHADDTPSVLAYRVGQTERRLENKADKEEVDLIREEVQGLKKAVWGLLAGIVGSSVLVSLTLFATLGSHLAG